MKAALVLFSTKILIYIAMLWMVKPLVAKYSLRESQPSAIRREKCLAKSRVVSICSLIRDGVPEQTAPDQVLDSQPSSSQPVEVAVTNPLVRAAIVAIALLTAFILFFWGAHSLRTSDPYVQSVLQIAGNPARGKDIFTLNCATCHGLEAAGEVGPALQGISERRSRVALIEQVTSGQTPPMPQFQPNEQDMADLLSFLEKI